MNLSLKEPMLAAPLPGGRSPRPIRVVGMLGMALAACLSPWIFQTLFAMGPLLPDERQGLWAGAVLMAIVSGLLIWRARSIPPLWAAVVPGLIFTVSLEFTARAGVNIFARDKRGLLARLADRTRPEFMQIRGHPFLHYTGNWQPGGRPNNYGFSGPDFQLEKPRGVLRVVCLGGSTTESYWPFQMNALLSDATSRNSLLGLAFEVLNFGKVGYTSLHDFVNFSVNAIEFSPDYVVVHSGGNDSVARNWPHPVRRDYSDILKTFEIPPIPDKWPTRLSVIYRFAIWVLNPQPAWADLRNTLELDPATERVFNKPAEELLPFRHNIEKIVQFARLRSVRVVLTTNPYSTDPNVASAEESRHLDQCNEIIREIYRENLDVALLVDLDKELTGRNDLYADVIHMRQNGDAEIAVAVGQAIFEDAKRRFAR